MSRIAELIEELCPNGVYYKPLDSILKIRNGKDYKSLSHGEYPVYGSGGVMTHVDKYMYDKVSVLIPRKGSLGKIYYVDKPFWVVDTIFYTEIDEGLINPKFLYHLLMKMKLETLNQAGGVPSLTQKILNKIKVPVPPLKIQEEIVRILDRFTLLEAELEAELEARRKQYTYYQELMLGVDFVRQDSSKSKVLDDLFEMKAGKHMPASRISSNPLDGYPCYGGNGVRGYCSEFSHEGDYILIGRQGALCGNVQRYKGRFYATEHAVVVSMRDKVDSSWAFHYLTKMNLRQYASKSAQPGLNVSKLKKLPIADVQEKKQQHIGFILDKFDELVSDISSGLPAEIAARRKQYEYYRDQLLTFKELQPEAA